MPENFKEHFKKFNYNDLIEYFADAEIKVGKPDSGTYSPSSGVSLDGVEVYIVVGSNDTTVQ